MSTAPGEPSNGRWSRNQKLAAWGVAAQLAVPLAIGIGGWWVQSAIEEQSVSKDFVAIAIGILTSTPTEGDPKADELRAWALEVFERYTPVPLGPELRHELHRRRLEVSVLDSMTTYGDKLSQTWADQAGNTHTISVSGAPDVSFGEMANELVAMKKAMDAVFATQPAEGVQDDR
jgi:hypothetical protein